MTKSPRITGEEEYLSNHNSSYFLMHYAITKGEPPYYYTTLYDSQRRKPKHYFKKYAELAIGNHEFEWYQSHYHNYAVIKKNGIATDTLRWRAASDAEFKCFMVVNDTIVIDNSYLSQRPTVQSPIIIRDYVDLKEQYLNYGEPRMFQEYSDRSEHNHIPATLVGFLNYGRLNRQYMIYAQTVFLPTSPLEGKNISKSFLGKHQFVYLP